MLSRRTLVERDGIGIAEVACRWARGPGQGGEHPRGHALVFVRRGCFVREADGVASTLDTTLAYCVNPEQEERYDHPHAGGDDCTVLYLSPEMVASLEGGEPWLPRRPLPAWPEIDLEHRLLLSAARRGDDPHELVERAIALPLTPSSRTIRVPSRQGVPQPRKRVVRSSPERVRRSPPTRNARSFSSPGSSLSRRTI